MCDLRLKLAFHFEYLISLMRKNVMSKLWFDRCTELSNLYVKILN